VKNVKADVLELVGVLEALPLAYPMANPVAPNEPVGATVTLPPETETPLPFGI
jgi:hypothetical protein